MIDNTLVEKVCYIDKIGRKMRSPHNKFDIPDSSYSCRIISDKIKEAFGVSDDGGTIANEDKNKENDIGFIFNKIVDAVWGNSEAIEYISKQFTNKSNDPQNLISKIWSKYPSFRTTILTKSMQKLYKAAIDSTFERISSMKKSIADNKKYLDELFNGKNKTKNDISKEDKNDAEVMKAHEDNNKKIAYKVGCTINITKESKFYQEYMECETWKAYLKTNDPVRVCLPWAELWHAEHTLREPNVKEIKIICDWGYNKYPSIKINENNPLKDT